MGFIEIYAVSRGRARHERGGIYRLFGHSRWEIQLWGGQYWVQFLSQLARDSALNAFDRMQDRVLDAEAEAEALNEMRQPSLEDEFDKLDKRDEIDDELAKLKARLKEWK